MKIKRILVAALTALALGLVSLGEAAVMARGATAVSVAKFASGRVAG